MPLGESGKDVVEGEVEKGQKPEKDELYEKAAIEIQHWRAVFGQKLDPNNLYSRQCHFEMRVSKGERERRRDKRQGAKRL